MTRRNLIIARVGRQSLHPSWLTAGQDRNWDLYLCPYQPLAPAAADFDGTVGDVIAGPKWSGLRTLLGTWGGWRDYERIWLPDDDIFASQATLNRMFELAETVGFDLCAPALHDTSYYAHFSTMRNHRCFVRRTGFVEIMVPCFSRQALEMALPTLALTPTGWGWGLDSLWPHLLGHQGTGIIDATPVLHTRPVGAFRDPDLDRRVRAESDHIMAAHGCRQVHTTFEVLGADLQPLTLPPPALTALLADGWRYLWESEPAVLPWLVAAQAPDGGWPGYPIEGRPSCGAA